ncbi:MAG: thiol peroxidase [Campylobacterota bacterium]
MGSTKLKGNTVYLTGHDISVGSKAPLVELVTKDLSTIKVGGEKEKNQIIVVVPSLDTPVCASEARKFNEEASSIENTEVTIVSMDLPFAMGRFCTTEGIENLRVASDFRAKEFANAYGVLLKDGALAGLTARAIFIVDTKGKVVYKEVCPEITEEPHYDKVLQAAKKI